MTPEQREKRRAYERARYPKRRDADLARLAASYRLNRESKKRYNAEYALKNKDRIREQKRIYRRAHIQHILNRNREYWLRNPEKKREWQRRWNSKNPGKVAACDSRRRARELGAVTDDEATSTFHEWIKNQDFVSCTYCGVFISGKSIEIDHIVPVSRGGHHLPDNFCVSCRRCNASKSDFLLHEWPKCPEKFRFIQV